MSACRFAASLKDVREDAVLEHNGLRFRASAGLYARHNLWREFKAGDSVQVLVDRNSHALGLRAFRGGAARNGLVISQAFVGAAPAINSVRLSAVAADLLGQRSPRSAWSLVGVTADKTWCFQPTEIVLPRVRDLVGRLDDIAASAGFRRTSGQLQQQYLGERTSVTLVAGMAVAMSRGRECGALPLFVPYLSADRIKEWFTDLN